MSDAGLNAGLKAIGEQQGHNIDVKTKMCSRCGRQFYLAWDGWFCTGLAKIPNTVWKQEVRIYINEITCDELIIMDVVE